MKIKAYITHKQCERNADCQDRFCINKENRTIAVSDGMSQSIFQEYWAELLVKYYADNGHCSEEDRRTLCDKWLQRVESYKAEQEANGRNLWRLKNCIAERSGAGATICGVQFTNATDWKGEVLGDSCIVKVDMKKWTMELLSSEEKAFDNHPDYYDSFPEKKGSGTVKHFEGKISHDDLLLLVSDPFSDFFLTHRTDCKKFIDQILLLNSHDDFCRLVDNWREQGMHNDDSTLCVIEFDNCPDFNISYQDSIEKLIDEETQPEVKAEIEICCPTGKTNLQEESDVTSSDSMVSQYFKMVMNEIDKVINQAKKKGSKSKQKNVGVRCIEKLKHKLDNEFQKLVKEE